MALRGNISSIGALKARIRKMPVLVAETVAKKAAPSMTALTNQAFDAKRSVYGEPRPVGVSGRPLTLEASGETRRRLFFASNGTIVRASLGTRWARFLIGKYGILPNGALPADWSRKLTELVNSTKVDV